MSAPNDYGKKRPPGPPAIQEEESYRDVLLAALGFCGALVLVFLMAVLLG